MVQKLEEVAAIFYCQLKTNIIVSFDREQVFHAKDGTEKHISNHVNWLRLIKMTTTVNRLMCLTGCKHWPCEHIS